MIKIVDYYYLVLIRWFSYKLDYSATGLMAFTFMINLFSLVIPFVPDNVETFPFGLGFVVAMMILSIIVLDIIYNKKRRERIRKQYRRESRESRQRGVVMVVLYEVLSFAFFIFTFVVFVKPHP